MSGPTDARSRSDSGRSRGWDGTDLRGRIWHWGSRLTVTVGLLCAVAHSGWGMPLAEVLVFSFCAGFVAAGILAPDGLSAAPKVTRIALWTGVTLTAVGGLVSVFGVAGLFLLLALLAISPAVRFCADNRWFTTMFTPEALADPPAPVRTSPRGSAETTVERTPLPQDLDALDDAALCRAWRRSFSMLESARTGQDRIAVVVQRQLYLDEMQRRSPSGVAAWLASGARASSNPMPFLGDGGQGPSS
jgi:hypothetical protein